MLNWLKSNQYASSGISLFLMMYASTVRPQLPAFIVDLFENPVFRVLILSLVVFMRGHNLQLSVLIAVAFTVTMNLISEQKIAEGFVDGVRENMLTEGFDDLDDIDDIESMTS